MTCFFAFRVLGQDRTSLGATVEELGPVPHADTPVL